MFSIIFLSVFMSHNFIMIEVLSFILVPTLVTFSMYVNIILVHIAEILSTFTTRSAISGHQMPLQVTLLSKCFIAKLTAEFLVHFNLMNCHVPIQMTWPSKVFSALIAGELVIRNLMSCFIVFGE